MTLKIGSLFSGYGGLEMGVQAVLGGDVAWHVEYDAAPSKVLSHHWPTVPNHGDVTKVDWSAVEPVDVLTGGFPCQDLSMAGRRAGMRPGTRSGLWADYLTAIATLRPSLVIVENVRGLLSGCAESDLEPCPGCLGVGEHRPVLRALGRVLGDLAGLGYDARWCGLRAADAGAPHGRFRVFVLAYPQRDELARERREDGRLPAATRSGQDAAADSDGELRRSQAWRAIAATGSEPTELRSAKSVGLGGTPADAGGSEPERRRGPGLLAVEAGANQGAGEERERLRDATGDRGAAAADTDGRGRGADRSDLLPGEPDTDWGAYTAAVHRWERCIDRTAPAPTVAKRLSPPFVEWMMGLPAGHVTAQEIGLSRTQQLKALGNGVVPQQAALAVRMLLGAAA